MKGKLVQIPILRTDFRIGNKKELWEMHDPVYKEEFSFLFNCACFYEISSRRAVEEKQEEFVLALATEFWLWDWLVLKTKRSSRRCRILSSSGSPVARRRLLVDHQVDRPDVYVG
jgi:hypothetical protein